MHIMRFKFIFDFIFVIRDLQEVNKLYQKMFAKNYYKKCLWGFIR